MKGEREGEVVYLGLKRVEGWTGGVEGLKKMVGLVDLVGSGGLYMVSWRKVWKGGVE